MKPNEREQLAAQRAEEYARKPTGGYVVAGLSGAALAFVADLAVSQFYGWQVLDHWWIAIGGSATGLAVAIVIYATLSRCNRRAQRSERARIDRGEAQRAAAQERQ